MIDDPGTREALRAMILNMCLPSKLNKMNEVWVVESGRKYQESHVSGVFSSPDRAIFSLKNAYREPYVVTWDQPVVNEDQVAIVARFDYVPQCSVRHAQEFFITKWKVDDLFDPSWR